MCLSIPAEIIEINEDHARVSLSGNIYSANIGLLEDVNVGDYILLHAGFAIQKISEEDANATLELLEEMKSSTKKLSDDLEDQDQSSGEAPE